MRIERLAGVPEADRAPLLDLWIASWAAVIPSMDVAADRGWLSEHLDEVLRHGAVLLLARSRTGVPRGFITVQREAGTIDQLAVDPACWRRGLGRRLMEEAKRLSPAGLRLRVSRINDRAVRFYGAAGFTVTGEAISERSGLALLAMAWPGRFV